VDQWDWGSKRKPWTAEATKTARSILSGILYNSWQATDITGHHLSADLIVRDKNGRYSPSRLPLNKAAPNLLSADKIEGVPDEITPTPSWETSLLRSEVSLIRSSSGYIWQCGKATPAFNDAKFLNHASGARRRSKVTLSINKMAVDFIDRRLFLRRVNPNNESWKFRQLDWTENPTAASGTAKHYNIRIADLPIFYFPWYAFS